MGSYQQILLVTFFSKNINLAHIKLISLFMMAPCKAMTVCFSQLSTCFDSPAKANKLAYTIGGRLQKQSEEK